MKVVDIVVVTYNHEEFIAKALEGILMQKVNFSYRVLVGEDCSTDETAAVVAVYAARYPNIIFPYYSKVNLGVEENSLKILSMCDAEYIAICDGDDYWTDPYKLQKQVCFLKDNPGFSSCFMSVRFLTHDNLKPHLNYYDKDVYELEDVIEKYHYNTSTLLFRNILVFPLPSYPTVCVDYSIVLMLALSGSIKFFPEIGAVYRVHPDSVQQKVPNGDLYYAQFKLLDGFNEYTRFKYKRQITKRLKPTTKTMLMYGSGKLRGMHRYVHIWRSLRGYLKYNKPMRIKELSYYLMVLFLPFVLKRVNRVKSPVKQRKITIS